MSAISTPAPPKRRLTKRQRERAFRGTLYGLLIVGTLALLFLADWATIGNAFFKPSAAADTMPLIVTRAARNTIIYTLGSFTLGLALGLSLALMKISPIAPYRWMATIYIEFFRGLPAILTIFLVGFGVPIAFGWQIPGGRPGAGMLALGLVAAAYMAETIRAGIEAVDKGQVEAARSLGMTKGRAMVSIVLPQAFRIIIPPLTNEIVLLIKDTSLIFVIGFGLTEKELFTFGRDIANDSFNSTPLIVAGVMYLIITLPLTRLVAQLEKRNRAAR